MRSGYWVGLLIATPALAHGPMLGGWNAVAHPDHDAQVRAAAAALVAQLPVRQPHLRRIEFAQRQVAAGMNFRLTVQLTDRSEWRGVVWHKPDGTVVVTAKSHVP